MTRRPSDELDTAAASPAHPRVAALERRVEEQRRRIRALEIHKSILSVAVLVLLGSLVGVLTRPGAGAGIAGADPADWGNLIAGLAVCLVAVAAGGGSLIAGVTAWRHVTAMPAAAVTAPFAAALALAFPILAGGIGPLLGGGSLLGWMDPGVRTVALAAAVALAAIGACNLLLAAANRRRLDADR